MRQSSNSRSRHKTRRRGALGLFVAVWLNLALAPCAMANQAAGDHDCPNCPPEADMPGHHDMHAGKHAPVMADMPCADDLTDCSLDGDFSLDTRCGTSKFKGAQYELPVAIVAELPLPLHDTPHRQRAPPWQAIEHDGAPPPLHLLHCVFLD